MKTSLPSSKWRLWLLLGLALPFNAATGRADVHLSPLFGDGAVLQRGMAVPVWGSADADEAVTVRIAGEEARATADASGRWSVKLPELKAGGPFEMVVAGKNTVTVHNVAVGEVWIASGQSNMAFRLVVSPADSDYGRKAKADIDAANDPLLRMFAVTRVTSEKPVDNLSGPKGAWQVSTPQTAGGFSAVAYHFARELRGKLKVPVGIIHSSWGGTPAEAWTSREALEADPELKRLVETSDKRMVAYPAEKTKYEEETVPAWQKEVEKAKAEGRPAPAKPRLSISLPGQPAYLFNAMISPLIPYGVKGVIWYQGEANATRAAQYRKLFPAMIGDWRARWNEGDFPFLFVQLANYQAVQTQPSEGGWAPLREAQMMTLSLPHTGMASAIDLADPEKPTDIHPHNKREVGRRLSLAALAIAYGEKVPSDSGPLYSGVKISGKEARVSFTHVDGGLMARGGEKLQGFAIAGKDGKFVWGDAKIDGDAVVVSSEQVAEPVAVRYSWASNPIGNLVNKEGLPASSFRTDPDSAK